MLIAKHTMRPESWTWRKEFPITYNRKVLTSSDGVQEIFRWIQDVHEEADNRMVIHIRHMLEKGICNIKVRTLDTDVIVILLSFMYEFIQINELVCIMVDFGSGDSRRDISINRSFTSLGEAVALTGCDSTSAFYRKTKKTFFESWMNYPKYDELTMAFQQLSWLPTIEIVHSCKIYVEQFVTHMYL